MNVNYVQAQDTINIQSTDRQKKCYPGNKGKLVMSAQSETQHGSIKCTHDLIYTIEDKLSRLCAGQTTKRRN